MEEPEKEVPAEPEVQELPTKTLDTGGAIPGVFAGSGREEKLDQRLGAIEWILVIFSYLLLILTFPVSFWLCLQIVTEFEQAVILRLGHIRKGGAVRQGVYFILPCIDILIKVDMRARTLNIPLQEVLTKDPLSLGVDGAIYYRVQDPLLAVKNITNPDSATLLLTQITLGNVLGSKYLSQIICNREKIAQDIQSIVDNALSNWGIKVEQIEIRNVRTQVKSGESPVSSGESASLRSPEKASVLEARTDAPRTVKESSIIITESPRSLKFHCVETEITGSNILHSSTRYAITEDADFGEGPFPTEG